MIAGPSVFICDSCVGLALDAVREAVVADPRGDARLNCSFCGKSAGEVEKLVAGPDVHICDGCVSLCGEVLAEV